MLLHQALDRTIKYCRISATELAKVSGVSSSRISQFRNGLFVEGKGSDLTSKAIDNLIDAAAEIDPRAKQVFSLFLADRDPQSLRQDSTLLSTSQLEAMDSSQISQLLVAIADILDKPTSTAKKTPQNRQSNRSLVKALNAS